MSNPYQGSIERGQKAFAEWRAKNPHVNINQSVWSLPKDCPLWHMGLSMAQAVGIVMAARKEEAK